MTSSLTRYSTSFEFSTATRKSTTRIPVIPLKVFVALEKPILTASSKLFGELAIISCDSGDPWCQWHSYDLLTKFSLLKRVYTKIV